MSNSNEVNLPIEPSGAPGASRSDVLRIDKLERTMGFFASFVALASSLLYLPHILHNTYITETAKMKNGVCPTGYTKVVSQCHHQLLTHPSYWMGQFLALVILGLFILLFTIIRNRPGLIVASLLLGLASGTAGLLYLAFGLWLIVRAFRLRRTGEAGFRASNAVARGQAGARRNKRSSADQNDGTVTKPVSASKRYTPKKPGK